MLPFKAVVKAGNHARGFCPVSLIVPKDSPALSGLDLNNPVLRCGAEELAVQAETLPNGSVVFHWIADGIEAGGEKVYELGGGKPVTGGAGLVQKESSLDITMGGKYFSSYVYGEDVAKPYIGPVIGPYGDSYTRLDFEIKEHPHHRSIWLAIGDVNGIDMWNEPANTHGKQLHQSLDEAVAGPVFARIAASNVWTSFKGSKQIDERRVMTFYNTPESGRFIDMDVVFTANYGQVEFGATKEAGPLGIRLAESMKVNNGGTMVNSYGASGEAECWGKRAQWCDYFGMVGGNMLGIAAFDHPDNERYPAYWHIRNYGLMAPNNFYFDGGFLIKPGGVVKYKYRIYFHEGDTAAAGVGARYIDYITPPLVELLD